MNKALATCIFFMTSLSTWAQFPGCPAVEAGADQTLNCPGQCATLTAQPIVTGLTTGYTVSSINYAPPIAYNAPGGTPISVNTDDVWSPNIQLPFNFCFYGQTFTTCRVGSNGAIRMGGGGGNNHPWMFSSSVPSPNLTDAGNIFGIYHDIDPSVSVPNGGGQVKWYLMGEAPCRIFIVSFYEMAHFACNNLRSTHMMVLYETTNVIDVYVEKKETCQTWNSGRAVIGIQNFNGSQGLAAPGRNTGPWQVFTPEAWRFSPSGTPTYSISWLQNGQVISNNLSIDVCPTTTSTYTASVTYTPCAGGAPVTVTDETTVFVNSGITPTFPQNTTTYCQGANIPPLPTSSSNGIQGVWTPALNNTQTTTYTFTPNPNQCASQVQTTIQITPQVTPTFSFPEQYCTGSTIPNFPTVSDNGISGTWSPQPNNQQTNTYTFTPSNSQQCAIPTSKTISILPFQIPQFDTFGPYCEGANIPSLPNFSQNAIFGTWTPVLNNQETTTYTFTAGAPQPGSQACASENASTTITIIPNEDPIFNLPQTSCFGSAIEPFPTISINDVTGTWTPAINNQQTTTYTFSSGSAGCFNPYTWTLEILPLAESINNHQHCQNNLPYFWNGQSLATNGLYEAHFIGANGCDSVAKIQFSVVQTLYSMTVVNVCENNLPYLWNGLELYETGSYTVALLSASGCDSLASLSLHVKPLPQFDFSATLLSACGTLETQFSYTSSAQAVELLWSFGDGFSSTEPGICNRVITQTGCHSVSLQLTDQFGCTNTVQKSDYVCIFPNPRANFVVSANVLNAFNQEVQCFNLSENASNYLWNFGLALSETNWLNPKFTYPDTNGTYTIWLYATNEFGCIDSTARQIQVNIEPIYYIPNAFTPDGDLHNNVFLPVFTSGFDPYQYKLLIFNRWGEVLFESRNAQVGWDGTYGGNLMQDDVYLYTIEYKSLTSGETHRIQGHVNLLK